MHSMTTTVINKCKCLHQSHQWFCGHIELVIYVILFFSYQIIQVNVFHTKNIIRLQGYFLVCCIRVSMLSNMRQQLLLFFLCIYVKHDGSVTDINYCIYCSMMDIISTLFSVIYCLLGFVPVTLIDETLERNNNLIMKRSIQIHGYISIC